MPLLLPLLEAPELLPDEPLEEPTPTPELEEELDPLLEPEDDELLPELDPLLEPLELPEEELTTAGEGELSPTSGMIDAEGPHPAKQLVATKATVRRFLVRIFLVFPWLTCGRRE